MPDVWDPARNPWQRASTERDRRRISLSIGEENARRIRACRWLVAYLEGQEPDSGTVVELGYAAGLGKLCFALRSDTRQAGEPGVRLNLQVEAIVVASGGAMYGSLDALVEGLRARQTGPAPS
jgi:nucleoside 2-deoxyribosyltransferase